MKIVAWVPIKMNNERLPGKNILPLAGKPLCQHVLGELLGLNGVDDVYVFCSEEEIEDYVQKEVVRIPRDATLNSFSTKINDVILSFTKTIDADIYIYAQVTSPFLKKETIQEGLNVVLSGKYDSALSVKKLRDFLWMHSKPFNYDPANIARTQDLEPLYQETGGFYIYTRELIEHYNRRTGFNPYFAEVSEVEAVDIDYREDYELAQSIVLKDHGRMNDSYNISFLGKWAVFAENGGRVNAFFEAFGYSTCAIYGGGFIGSRLYDALNKDIVDVKYFIDCNVHNCRGLRCVKPDDLVNEEAVDVIVVTPGYDYKRIKALLNSNTARVVVVDEILNDTFAYYHKNLVDGAVYASVKSEFKKEYTKMFVDYSISEYYWDKALDEFLRICIISRDFMTPKELKNNTIGMCQSILSKDVSIPILDLVVTTRCSLKCRKCFHLIPEYTKRGNTPFDIDFNIIKKDLDKLLTSVDYIFKVNVLGGEPFLYSQLDELLIYLLRCEKVGYFNIVTNSTIIPDDRICEILKNKLFNVFINDYGTKASMTEELIAKLKKFGVTYSKSSEGIWYDFGVIKKLSLSENDLINHYSKCSFACCKALMDGELHTCGFHKHGQRTGLLPDSGDSLHIHEYKDDDLKRKIVDFYKAEYFEACDYCNAPNRQESTTIPAGEQE